MNGARVPPEQIEAARDILGTYRQKLLENEPGCTLFRVLEDASDPCSVMVIADFVDDAAYEAHLRSPHVAWLREHLHPIIGNTHTKTVYNPAGRDGIDR